MGQHHGGGVMAMEQLSQPTMDAASAAGQTVVNHGGDAGLVR